MPQSVIVLRWINLFALKRRFIIKERKRKKNDQVDMIMASKLLSYRGIRSSSERLELKKKGNFNWSCIYKKRKTELCVCVCMRIYWCCGQQQQQLCVDDSELTSWELRSAPGFSQAKMTESWPWNTANRKRKTEHKQALLPPPPLPFMCTRLQQRLLNLL